VKKNAINAPGEHSKKGKSKPGHIGFGRWRIHFSRERQRSLIWSDKINAPRFF